MQYVKILFLDIKTLGFVNGFKYFIMRLRCQRNPQLILEWADNCDKESNKLSILGRHEEAEAFSSFAKHLRVSYRESVVDNYYLIMDDGERIPNLENMAAFLLTELVLFVNTRSYYCPFEKKSFDTTILFVSCNDYFAPAADAENITSEEIPKLYELYGEKGFDGVYEFVAEKRNIKNEHWKLQYEKSNN
jgi:hypothetical protein